MRACERVCMCVRACACVCTARVQELVKDPSVLASFEAQRRRHLDERAADRARLRRAEQQLARRGKLIAAEEADNLRKLLEQRR